MDGHKADGVPQSGGVGIAEAAKLLNLSPAALRKRVHRGSVPAYKGEDGNWYVLVDQVKPEEPDPDPEPEATPAKVTVELTPPANPVIDDYVASLKDQVAFLRSELEHRNIELSERSEELRRKDYLLAQLTQRLPELPERVPDIEPPSPWWKRLLGVA